ncbi:MAG TPA: permease prefix domain 1-containing protein [Dehalococcoidia bacterium]|nr:permease prefix domain 1-containing protein [Dehalococcoidia bacterium]
MPEPGLIDEYLDRLAAELRLDGRRVRRVLLEAEDHLREAAQQFSADGLPWRDAEQRAIDRFGSPRTVAHRFAAEERRAALPAIGVELVLALGLLFGVGMSAIGASGLVAGVFGAVFGKSFVSGDTNGVTYVPARCADFLSYFPNAGSCEAAATAHHFGEVVTYRIAAGVLGLLALGGCWWLRRRLGREGRGALPEGFTATVGAALFGLAALALLGMGGLPLLLGRPNGAGGLLSGGMVALAVFAGFGGAFLRVIRPVAA